MCAKWKNMGEPSCKLFLTLDSHSLHSQRTLKTFWRNCCILFDAALATGFNCGFAFTPGPWGGGLTTNYLSPKDLVHVTSSKVTLMSKFGFSFPALATDTQDFLAELLHPVWCCTCNRFQLWLCLHPPTTASSNPPPQSVLTESFSPIVAILSATFGISPPPSCTYRCTADELHLPIRFTSSTSMVAWYSAVAPPIRRLCDKNLSGGSPTPLAARCSRTWTSIRFSTLPEDQRKRGFTASPDPCWNLAGHTFRMRSNASTGHKWRRLVAFSILTSPKPCWSDLVFRNVRVTSLASPWFAGSPLWENRRSHPRRTISSSTPLESAYSLALSIQNHAVSIAPMTMTASDQVVFRTPSFSNGSHKCSPSHTNMPAVTPNRLGFLTVWRSIALVRIQIRCILAKGSPQPALLCLSFRPKTACLNVFTDAPSHPR